MARYSRSRAWIAVEQRRAALGKYPARGAALEFPAVRTQAQADEALVLVGEQLGVVGRHRPVAVDHYVGKRGDVRSPVLDDAQVERRVKQGLDSWQPRAAPMSARS